MLSSVKDLCGSEVTNVSPLFLRLDKGSPLRPRLKMLAPQQRTIGRCAPAELTAVSPVYAPSQMLSSSYIAPPTSGTRKAYSRPEYTGVTLKDENGDNCDCEEWPKVIPSNPGFRCHGGYRSMTNDSKIKKINEDLDERLNYYIQKVPLSTSRTAPDSPAMQRTTETQSKPKPKAMTPQTALFERLKLWYKDSATVLQSKDKDDREKDAALNLANEELKRVRGRLETLLFENSAIKQSAMNKAEAELEKLLFENSALKQNAMNKAEAEVHHHVCCKTGAMCSPLHAQTQRCPHCGHEFPRNKKRMIQVLDNDQVFEMPREQVSKASPRRCPCPHCGTQFTPNSPRVTDRDSEVPLAKSPRSASRPVTLPINAFEPRQQACADFTATPSSQGPRASPQARHVATSPMLSVRETTPRARHMATSPILSLRETSPPPRHAATSPISFDRRAVPQGRHVATSPVLPYRVPPQRRDAASNAVRGGKKQQRRSVTSWSTSESSRSSECRLQKNKTRKRRSLQQQQQQPKSTGGNRWHLKDDPPRRAEYKRPLEHRHSDVTPPEWTKYVQSPQAIDAPSKAVADKAALVEELVGQVHVEAQAYQNNIAHLADLLEKYEGVRTHEQ